MTQVNTDSWFSNNSYFNLINLRGTEIGHEKATDTGRNRVTDEEGERVGRKERRNLMLSENCESEV